MVDFTVTEGDLKVHSAALLAQSEDMYVFFFDTNSKWPECDGATISGDTHTVHWTPRGAANDVPMTNVEFKTPGHWGMIMHSRKHGFEICVYKITGEPEIVWPRDS
jgi:hypothetical protein